MKIPSGLLGSWHGCRQHAAVQGNLRKALERRKWGVCRPVRTADRGGDAVPRLEVCVATGSLAVADCKSVP